MLSFEGTSATGQVEMLFKLSEYSQQSLANQLILLSRLVKLALEVHITCRFVGIQTVDIIPQSLVHLDGDLSRLLHPLLQILEGVHLDRVEFVGIGVILDGLNPLLKVWLTLHLRAIVVQRGDLQGDPFLHLFLKVLGNLRSELVVKMGSEQVFSRAWGQLLQIVLQHCCHLAVLRLHLLWRLLDLWLLRLSLRSI